MTLETVPKLYQSSPHSYILLKVLEETCRLSWHPLPGSSLWAEAWPLGLLGTVSDVHLSARSWLSVWDWPNHKQSVLSLLQPPLGREHPGKPSPCFGGLQASSCSAVSGWGRSNQGRRKRNPVWALGLSHMLQSIWTSNKVDVLIPACLLWLFLSWIRTRRSEGCDELAPADPSICWILSPSGKSHSEMKTVI